ncbi:hypothetical protein GPA27_22505 [Aromatoleum toluolicum]|uniref:hypothetical protein n=1 Tax=Aromatoleum toluolicum TaxID=90060 RepID=UPI001B7CF036|nr:hypothetical protein [Aromatoleum toluolicum]MCQ6964035.1 hypothetical protein [Aromatoleum toluolicum]
MQQSDADGRFIRQHSAFRDRIGAGSAKRFAAEAGRYQLYVAYICPWASRTLIALRLKGYSIAALNPSGIVPVGPELDYLEPLRTA